MVGLLTSEPRYIVADVEYETTDGRTTDKIVFMSWLVHVLQQMQSVTPVAGFRTTPRSATR
jgi:hypothetical protein